MRKITPVLLIVVLVASLGLAACGDNGDGEERPHVKIAVSAPLGLDLGQNVVNALEMGLEEREGRVGDVDVSLLVLNSSEPEGDPVSVDMERTIAQQAAEDDAVVAYIGPMTTDQAKASIPILNQASIPQITESATWPGLTKPGFGPGEPGIYYPTGRRTFFRVLPADDVQAVGGARWMSDLGYENVYVVSAGTGYGDGVCGIFQVAAHDVGLDVIGRATLDPEALEADDLAPVVEDIIEAEPEIVYFGGSAYPAGVAFVGALRAAAPELPVMGTDGLFQEEVITEIGADLVEGIYITISILPTEELASARPFVERYTEKYGEAPVPYALTAYAALESVFAALEHAEEPTREGVLNALTELDAISGVFGTWAFDSNGDTTYKALGGWRITGGEWTFVDVLGTDMAGE